MKCGRLFEVSQMPDLYCSSFIHPVREEDDGRSGEVSSVRAPPILPGHSSPDYAPAPRRRAQFHYNALHDGYGDERTNEMAPLPP